MMFKMTRMAKNNQIINRVIGSVMVNVVNFKSTITHYTMSTLMRKFGKSDTSIKLYPVFIVWIVFAFERGFEFFRVFLPKQFIFAFFTAIRSMFGSTWGKISGFATVFTNYWHFIFGVPLVKALKGAKQFSTGFNNKFLRAVFAIRESFRMSRLLSATYRAISSFFDICLELFRTLRASIYHKWSICHSIINKQVVGQ